MQQPGQPAPDAATAPAETATTNEDFPAQCPVSHRVARKASVAIIAALCVLIAATVVYVLASGSQ